MNILALIPVKRNLHAKLRLRCLDNILNLQSYFQNKIDIRVDCRGPGDSFVSDFRGRERIANLCAVRQGMIDDYLRKEHTHVLILDADAVYSSKEVARLIRTSQENPNDIVAPSVLIEGDKKDRWYDIWGFIPEPPVKIRLMPPHFDVPDRLVPMQCVGVMYVVPSFLFRDGAKYYPVDGQVDHYSVCKFARDMGRRVLCDTRIVVRHPRLTRFGERRK